jgi:hypothetical protein
MKTHYTDFEQRKFLVQDLTIDAECAEKQAANGPFYPESGITEESLLAYARECREKVKTPARTLSGIRFQFFTPGRDACCLRLGSKIDGKRIAVF